MAKELNIPNVSALLPKPDENAETYKERLDQLEITGKAKPLLIAAQTAANVWQALKLESLHAGKEIVAPESTKDAIMVIMSDFMDRIQSATQSISSEATKQQRLVNNNSLTQSVAKSMGARGLKPSKITSNAQTAIDRSVEKATTTLKTALTALNEALDGKQIDDENTQAAITAINEGNQSFSQAVKEIRRAGGRKK